MSVVLVPVDFESERLLGSAGMVSVVVALAILLHPEYAAAL
jgi:hypothetical protein